MTSDEPYVELRVHGVSGTPPADLLGTTEVEDVAGDELVRFVRIKGAAAACPGEGVLEGMSWGGLTSGVASQAAWVVMLPFALVNLALFTGPALSADRAHGGSAWSRAWMFRACLRLLALTVTVLLTLATAMITMDLVAWQCVDGRCPFVEDRFAALAGWSTGTRIAVAALVPVVTLGAIAWLSHRVSLRYEATSASDVGGSAAPAGGVRAGQGDPGEEAERESDGDEQPNLFAPLMWHGEPLVQRLRAVHLAVGWATLALLLTWSADRLTDAAVRTGPSAWMGWTALVLGVATTAAGVVLVGAPSRWSAWTYRAAPYQRPVAGALQGAALVAVVLAALVFRSAVDRATDGGAAGPDPRTAGTLPGLTEHLTVVVAAQVGLLLILGLVLATRPRPRRGPRGAQAAGTRRTTEALPALGGLAPWVIGASGVLLQYVFAAGLALRLADVLTATSEDGAPPHELALPVLMRWAAGGFAVIVVLLVVRAVIAAWAVTRQPQQDVLAVLDDYEVGLDANDPGSSRDARHRSEHWRDDYRIRRIVRSRRTQRLVQARAVVNGLAAGGIIGILIAVVALATNLQLFDALLARLGWRTELSEVRPSLQALAIGGRLASWGDQLTRFGSWLLVALAVGILAALVTGLRSPGARRRIGIVWDVLSFWPRGCHPFAPPSYTERAVPQLIVRTRYLARTAGSATTPGVVLSAHSQGSALAVAVLAQLHTLDHPDEVRWYEMPRPRVEGTLDRVALLTHGSPIGRLYEPLFPQYFGGGRTAGDGTTTPSPQLLRIRESVSGRWINLWRDTDPIGSSLRRVLDHHDRRCTDPAGYLLDEERAAYPQILGHSNYAKSPEHDAALQHLVALRTHEVGAAQCDPDHVLSRPSAAPVTQQPSLERSRLRDPSSGSGRSDGLG